MIFRLASLIALCCGLFVGHVTADNVKNHSNNSLHIADESAQVRELIEKLEQDVAVSLDAIEHDQDTAKSQDATIDKTSPVDVSESQDEPVVDFRDLLESFDAALEETAFNEIERGIGLDDLDLTDVELERTLKDRWHAFKLGMLTLFLESYIDTVLLKYGDLGKELTNKELIVVMPAVLWRFNIKSAQMMARTGAKVWQVYATEQYGEQAVSLSVAQKAWVSYVITKTATLTAAKAGIDSTKWAVFGVVDTGVAGLCLARDFVKSTTVSAWQYSLDRYCVAKEKAAGFAAKTYNSITSFIGQWV